MAIPGIPQNVTLQEGNGQVYLDWSLQAGATSYVVQRSLDSVVFTDVGTTLVNNYLDTTVVVGTEYFYRVCSSNGDGVSSPSAIFSVVPAYAGQLSLGSLRLQAQQRADRVSSQFVTKSEWNSYLNQSAFELYDLLVTKFEDYYLSSYDFVSTGVDRYVLPIDFYKLLGVDCGITNSSDGWVSLQKFDFIARNRNVYPSASASFAGVFNLKYRVMGQMIIFSPSPQSGQNFRVWHVPRMKQMLRDSDILDGVSGWTEYVIVDAAIKALMKEESDVSMLMLQKQALMVRIEESAANRDAGQPDTISDTRGSTGGMGWGFNGGGY